MIWLLLTILALAAGTSHAEYYGPRPSSIQHFVVMDSVTGLKDLAKNADPAFVKPEAQLDTKRTGPFGETLTSYTVSTGTYIANLNHYPFLRSFTLACYFVTAANATDGAILGRHHNSRFNVGYSRSSLVVRGAHKNSADILSTATFDGFFVPNQWQFVALTYDADRSTLQLYDDGGMLLKTWANFKRYDYSGTTQLFFGYTSSNPPGMRYMYPSDSMACVFQYDSVLSPADIAELPEVCRRKGQPPAWGIAPWPSPEHLLGFWPLSNAFEFRDIGPSKFGSSTSYDHSASIAGPFGGRNTGTKATAQRNELFRSSDGKLSTNDLSFTVAFFFKPSTSGSGDLFEFLNKEGTNKAFQLRYDNLTVEASAGGKTVGKYEMIQTQSAWTYAAFAFDDPTALLTVYSQFGVFRPAELQPYIELTNYFNNNGIRFGHSTRWGEGPNAGDSFACAAVYAKALTWPEVEQLVQSCRIVNGQPLQGQPKPPLASIPDNVGIATTPEYGQFPSIASLRKGWLHVCSASILSPFWLLTSADCFAEAAEPSSYSVVVGEYDLAVNETDQVTHRFSEIFFSGKSKRDVALLQLSSPVDMTNDYVGDAFVYTGKESNSLTWLYTTQYFVGWGANGRYPTVSQMLPRMVTGDFYTGDRCTEFWGGQFDKGSDLCFSSRTPVKDVPCKGDEGSPVYVPVEGDEESGTSDRLLQVGLYYGRDENCTYSKPALFVNLAIHANWIQQTIACAVPNFKHPATCPQ